jgi:hypothetical protein
MKTKVELILDSISSSGKRITTFLVTHPHIISEEIRKHRDLSVTTRRFKNINTVLKQVNDDPYMPECFDDSTESLVNAKLNWKMMAGVFDITTNRMNSLSCEYDMLLSVLRPFAYIQTVITATNFDNFIAKRSSVENGEMATIANWINSKLKSSKPIITTGWHLPFASKEWHGYSEVDIQLACSLLCRREMKYPDIDLNEAHVLMDGNKLGCFEHVARPCEVKNMMSMSNFNGWIQLRKTLYNDRL